MKSFNSRKITIALLVLFAGFCFWQALPKSVSQNAADSLVPSATAEIGPSFSTKPGIETQAIETIRVGQRVLARNPEVERAERLAWGPEPDFSQWLHLTLEMPKEDGSTLTIEMLRPDEWVDSQLSYVIDESGNAKAESGQQEADTPPLSPFSAFNGPLLATPLSPLRPVFRDILFTSLAVEEAGAEFVGMTVQMDLPEMGAVGTAIVIDIQSGPQIEPAGAEHRQVVTARFRHPPSSTVLDVRFADDVETADTGLNSEIRTLEAVGSADLGVTDNHLFWSVDRQEFVPIGEMEIGERVQTYHGETKRIASKLARPGPSAEVYNLEVYGEHVYFVGEQTLLVHNECGAPELSWKQFNNRVGGRGYSNKQVSRLWRRYKQKMGVPETPVSARIQNVGATPGKASATGRSVIARMRERGLVRDAPGGATVAYDKATDAWHPLSEMDMGHIKDASWYWNRVGRYFGPKSSEVRSWMLDASNYELQHFSSNRSAGAKFAEQYLPAIGN